MKNKLTVVLLFLIFGSLIGSQSNKVSASDINTPIPEISYKSAIIRWRYKTVNGKLYQRQYNFSTEKWLGSWDLVE